ncbi:alpha/beta fold hydrolase [Polyangium aurulentum]|uniref:alpha/beta fold hydrolase n=1 Tax=Polyangium aurulentum TaxID=2567896 RepID=UPI0010ADE14B|nr:alpha/beta hydrolase [Polyangium aurulentum]UQA60764.1 alpha/beta fold hydrolase [Polyangium aurulentum]
MSHASAQPRKRTNVRLGTVERAAIGALSSIVPDLAAGYAERLFFSPVRYARPAWEAEILGRAQRQSFPFRGGELPAWSWGEGPVVVLAHGWAGRGSQLGKLVDPLVAAGHRVVAFDGPGHGDAGGASSSIADIADAIGALLETLGGARAIVGHSMGGFAARMAIRNAPVERLVLVASPWEAAAYPRTFPRRIGLGDAATERFVCRVEARLGAPIDTLNGDRHLLGPEVDLLVVHDEDDREVPFADAARLVSAWEGARLFTTHGLGHRRVLRDPLVTRTIAAFVADGPRAVLPRATGLLALEEELFHRHLRYPGSAAA